MKTCIHGVVSGRVQGVCFRAAAQDRARELGVVGWVRNLPDGRVEVRACGEHDRVDAFQGWLEEGPPAASVEAVSVDTEAFDPDLVGFDVV
jgi:acylphosphatase